MVLGVSGCTLARGNLDGGMRNTQRMGGAPAPWQRAARLCGWLSVSIVAPRPLSL